MPINPTKSRKNVSQVKETLNSAAGELFKKYGFDQVTVDDICSHCCISKGTFYHHFSSKEELVCLVYCTNMDNYIKNNYIINDQAPLLDQLRDFMICIFKYACEVGKDFMRRSYLGMISLPVDLMIVGRPMVDCIFHLIRRGISENAFAQEYTEEEYYTYLIGTLTGLLIKWCTCARTDYKWESLISSQAVSLLK